MRWVANRFGTMRLNRLLLLAITAICFHGAPAQAATPPPTLTKVSIQGESFYINGLRTFPGGRLDGTLPNSRMVQATFDDANPATVNNWKYPDGSAYNPIRQTNEFVAALPSYRAKGLLAVTVNFQGGDPITGAQTQPWDNTTFNSDGSLKPAYLARMDQVIRALDAQGMVAILGYFYFGQDGRLSGETAIKNAVTNATQWVLTQGYTNVLIEIDNEADSPDYIYAILQPARVSELISAVQTQSANFGRRLYVGVSLSGGKIPPSNITQIEDFILLHGNRQTSSTITSIVNTTRALGTNKPIIFNEDSTSTANFQAATDARASWGYYDAGVNNYVDGFQSPPTNWTINTIAKQNFFNLLASFAGPTPTPTPAPSVVRINCGGPAYTDSLGQLWSADDSLIGGSITTYSATQSISGTPDAKLYQSERYAKQLIYNITVPNGSYNVTLSFAEMYFNATGKRVFSVSLEGQTVLQDLDIWALVGQFAALQRTFNVTVNNGVLNIVATASINNAQLAAVEVTPIPPLSSVVSRMTHGSAGTFDVNFPLLPMASPRGVECRSGVGGVSGNYTLVFGFVNPLTSVTGASVTSHNPTAGTGSVSSGAIGTDTHQYIVNLTGVSDQQYITVTLSGVHDSTGASGNIVGPQMGVLIGDVNASGLVDGSDVSAVQSQMRQSVSSANFRDDVNASGGLIDGNDASIIQGHTRTSLPSAP
jgi:Malectin domain